MTLWQQTHEAGTAGSSVATGSGNAGNSAVAAIGTAPIITVTAGEVLSGSKSAKAQAAAGAASAANMPITAGTDLGVRFLYRITAEQLASTVDDTIHTLRSSAGPRVNVAVRGPDDKISVTDSTGTWVSPSAVTAGDYVFDFAWSTGTSTSDGKGKWKITKLSDGSYAAGMTAVVEQTGRNVGGGVSFTNVYVGAISTTSTPARTPIWDDVQAQDSYAFIAAAANAAPTVTAGATIVMTSGSTATAVFTANDSDGNIQSWETPSVVSTADVAPTVGTPVLTGMGTANATASYPISGLTNSDTTVYTRPIDNGGLPAAATVGARIIYTSKAPRARAVTLVGCTMTSPGSGTPKAAWNAWVDDQALATPTGIAAPEFTTAAPPASTATVTVDYQPLDVANVPPTFSQSWCLNPDTTTPATVYVDLKFSGVTVATASSQITTLTAVPVGRTLTTSENTAIGSGTLARVAPTVASRFA